MSTGFDVIIPHKLSFTSIVNGIEQLEAFLDEPIQIIERKRLPVTSLATNHFDYSQEKNCKGYYVHYTIPDNPLNKEYNEYGQLSINHNDSEKMEFALGKHYLQLWHKTDMHYWDAWQAIIESSPLFKGKQELKQPKSITSLVSKMVNFYAAFAKSKKFKRIYFFKEGYREIYFAEDEIHDMPEQKLLNTIACKDIPLVNFKKPIPQLDTSNLYELSPVLFLDIE